ncbi:MAG: hypothetical protein ACK56I_13745, partial [bacterium]
AQGPDHSGLRARRLVGDPSRHRSFGSAGRHRHDDRHERGAQRERRRGLLQPQHRAPLPA